VKGEAAKDSIPNLIRKFLLEIYRFDNALLEAPVTPQEQILQAKVPLSTSSAFAEFPDVKYVIDLRMQCEAKLLLHLGNCREAAEVYARLIRETPPTRRDQLPELYLGLAACQHGLGHPGRMERNLENTELATAALDSALNAAREAASLLAFYSFLERRRKSREWREFLFRLPCPTETKALFLRRSRYLLDRCERHSRLVVF
jgi:hypothetical protein